MALVMVDEFIRSGMTDACLAPGSRSSPMALALAQSPSIRLHVSIDERSASFLALGMAKKSQRPVALLTTSGTAAANLFPAVIEAHLSSVPLIVLTADRPPELRDTGAGQTIDQIKLFGGYAGWFAEAGAPESRPGSVQYWRSLACRAWAHALGGPAGPVHLNLAFRDPLTQVADEAGFEYSLDGREGGRPWHQFHPKSLEPSSEEMADVVNQVGSARRGIIVTGFSHWGIGSSEMPPGTFDAAPAVRLAAHLGWPLLAEATSGARVGGQVISTYDALLRSASFAAAHRPDLVLRFGSIGLSSALNQLLDESVRQIVVHNGPVVPDPRRLASQVIRAEPGLVCDRLCRAVTPSGQAQWFGSWKKAEELARSAIDEVLDEQIEVTEPGLARDLADCLPHGSTLVAASSMPVRDLDWYMRPREGLSLLSNRGANGIDGFISTVLGAALSSGGGYTAGLSGDLSMLHDQNGLIFAGNNPVDAAFVVVNNNGGGIFSFLPQAADEEHFELLFGTPHNVDLRALVGAYGLGYHALEAPRDLRQSLTAARAERGVHILEAKTDRRENVRLHKQLWAAVDAALG